MRNAYIEACEKKIESLRKIFGPLSSLLKRKGGNRCYVCGSRQSLCVCETCHDEVCKRSNPEIIARKLLDLFLSHEQTSSVWKQDLYKKIVKILQES